MLPDQVSNPGPLTYESGALPIALRGPAHLTYVPFILLEGISKSILFNSILKYIICFQCAKCNYFGTDLGAGALISLQPAKSMAPPCPPPHPHIQNVPTPMIPPSFGHQRTDVSILLHLFS